MHKPAAGNLRRVTVSSLFGSTIEWYDFFLYGTVAGMVFNKLYFPKATRLSPRCFPTACLPSAFSPGLWAPLFLVISATRWDAKIC